MHLDREKKSCYVYCCLIWLDINQLLWVVDDQGKTTFYCPNHPDVILGFEKDLE